MKLPTISIVIPSYNKARFVGETLQSIVDQKYPNLEVIIQDGGSTDGTLQIIKRYAKKYPRIFSYVSKKDNGQTDAINKGLKKAKGDVLSFINADDVYEKHALLKVGEYFAKHPDTLWLAGQGRVIDEAGLEIAKPVTLFKNILLWLNNYTLLLIVNYLMQPSVFFSKKAYKKFGPFTGVGKNVMEYDFWLKIGEKKMPSVLKTYISMFRIEVNSFSIQKTQLILKRDIEIMTKYHSNKSFIGVFHSIFNRFRFILSKLYD